MACGEEPGCAGFAGQLVRSSPPIRQRRPEEGRARARSRAYQTHVLRGLSALLPCRIAAALLILTLSGAAGLTPRARAAEHRCHCQGMMVNGRHVCSCPICRLAAPRATARGRAAPPSPGAAATGSTDEGMVRSGDGGMPCYVSECDHSGDLPGVKPSTEPFALPQLPTLRPDAVAVECGDVVSAPAERHTPPDSPPPRSRRL